MSVAAIHFEVKKHAVRQTADGWVISFVVHPNDMDSTFAVSPLGTRYMLAVAQIGDDEQIVPPAGTHEPKQERTTDPDKESGPLNPPRPAPAGERRPWETLTPQQQAGILCADKGFQKWLAHRFGAAWQHCGEADAAEWLRIELGVSSRRFLADQPNAIRRLNEIRAEFLEWAGRVPVAPR